MIDWKPLGKLITLYNHLHLLYNILDKEETIKYKDLIQNWSDRLYNKIRGLYWSYRFVAHEEDNNEHTKPT